MGKNERLYYLDNLRGFLAILVVAHHATQPWGLAGWYIKAEETDLLLNLFCGINASFFMGLFFLLSGYFHPPSYDRKGFGRFVRDRLLRLGVPLLAYSFLVMPWVQYVAYFYFQGNPRVDLGKAAGMYFWDGFGLGHLWFVAMLLLFGLAYALWRLAGKEPEPREPGPAFTLRQTSLGALGLALLLAGLTFLARVWFPQDEWVYAPWPFSLEPAHAPQYILLFVLGVLAFRRGLLERLPAKAGWIWLGVGFLPTLVFSPILMERSFLGAGFTLDGLAAAAREAFECVGVCLWLLVGFRTRLNRSGPVWRFLSANAYVVYIIHVPVLLVFQWAAIGLHTGPLVKFLLVSACSIPICFFLGALIRAIPGARRIL